MAPSGATASMPPRRSSPSQRCARPRQHASRTTRRRRCLRRWKPGSPGCGRRTRPRPPGRRRAVTAIPIACGTGRRCRRGRRLGQSRNNPDEGFAAQGRHALQVGTALRCFATCLAGNAEIPSRRGRSHPPGRIDFLGLNPSVYTVSRGTPEPGEVIEVLSLIATTGRGRLGEVHGPVLSEAGARTGRLTWIAQPDGRQKPREPTATTRS